MKLSPYGFDIGRFAALVARPNLGLGSPSAPNDDVFPDSGLITLPNVVSSHLCDAAIREYDEFEALRDRTGCAVRDEHGRNYRLANFHLSSPSLLSIGLQDCFHNPASAFFRRRSSIYTSLCYKHGSQQKGHIDTPFFWTRPFNLYVGVWVALEDVADDAGPLFYYPGSHRYFSSETQLKAVFERAGGDVQYMFDLMREELETNIKPERVLIKKGDAVIWHPGLMHGGSPATTSGATRYSMVFHFAPVGVNVRSKSFPNDFANIPTYGIKSRDGRAYSRVSLPAVMI
jgi:hypothetical protein